MTVKTTALPHCPAPSLSYHCYRLPLLLLYSTSCSSINIEQRAQAFLLSRRKLSLFPSPIGQGQQSSIACFQAAATRLQPLASFKHSEDLSIGPSTWSLPVCNNDDSAFSLTVIHH